MVFALQVSRAPNVAGGTLSAGNPAIGGNQPSSLRYMHHDHLGSVAAVTNEAGAVLEDVEGRRGLSLPFPINAIPAEIIIRI
jgi:hypothetical protein